MNKVVLLLVMIVLSTEGRVAWYGEEEFEDSVQSLEKEGYTIEYIDTIDEETLLLYDVLVVCLSEPSKNQKEVIDDFVKKGGGLLLIYNAVSYPEIADVCSEYNVESTLEGETVMVFPLLAEDAVEKLKKRVAVAQKEKGRIVMVGYDPLTFQTISLLMDVDSIFRFGMDWLCQDWHVKQTQALLAERWVNLVVPAVVVVAVLVLVGYVLQKRKKKEKPKLSDREEQIRELKARFVYGELSRDEYRQELEKLERSAK
jgi:uncharacterized membrane protein